MLPNRIHTSKASRDQLHMIKQRTGITPNLTARLAIARSLELGNADVQHPVDANGLEFNISTLFGEHAVLYERLLVDLHESDDPAELTLAISGHLERGLGGFKSIRNIRDLLDRLP